METSSSEQDKDKEEKAATEEGEEKRKKLEHDIGEGNVATAAAAALASAATKAKVSLQESWTHCLPGLVSADKTVIDMRLKQFSLCSVLIFSGIFSNNTRWLDSDLHITNTHKPNHQSDFPFLCFISTWLRWRRERSSRWLLCWWRPR